MKTMKSCHPGVRMIIPALVLLVTPGLRYADVSGAMPADQVVLVVSTSSSLTEIPRLHLADIYMGRTSRFPNGEPAVPIDQKAGSAARSAFYEGYLGRTEAQMKSHWSRIVFTGRGRPPAEAPTGEAVREMVARDPRAIGYIDAGLVNSSVRIIRVQ